MSTQIILLERVENLGNMGEIVSVKPGFARNYLLPQKKALRANKANVAYFEAQKKNLEAANAAARKEAEKNVKPLEGVTVSLIRQASESGQLFGSVAARDIAEALTTATKVDVTRNMVNVNQNFKFLGLFPVEVSLHPEVKVGITINIARNEEEAGVQLSTGRAITEDAPTEEETPAEALIDEENLSAALEDDALEAEKVKAEEDAVAAAEAEEKAAAKAAEKAEKAAAKAAVDAEASEDAPVEKEAPATEDKAAKEE